ncbi:MAG: hypothetical protein HY363_01705 [Candidatus Aenigmarchaeota archaeon]|nr:hypothetical protein [Candidatus Aenigmarchaeota archaeon]
MVQKELARKAVHVFAGVVLLAVSRWLYVLYGFSIMHFFLLFVTIGAVLADITMAATKSSLPIFKQLQRKQEKHGIHHHTLALLTILVLLKLIDTRIVAVSALMLVFGDAAAAVVGKLFGKHKIFHSKTWEGTTAMLSVSLFSAGIVLGVNMVSISMAVAATVAEAYSTRISDGITIPFAAALVGYVITSVV